jgi:hypothetical protein
MGFKLPPLSSVRVFEAAARHGSFKKAAEELNITASAVSHAVQNLEDWLGVALFQRGGGKLGLTEPGAAYAVAVGEALKAVAEATARLPGRRSQGRLAISSAPGFAALWLLPRLSRFTERYPEQLWTSRPRSRRSTCRWKASTPPSGSRRLRAPCRHGRGCLRSHSCLFVRRACWRNMPAFPGSNSSRAPT